MRFTETTLAVAIGGAAVLAGVILVVSERDAVPHASRFRGSAAGGPWCSDPIEFSPACVDWRSSKHDEKCDPGERYRPATWPACES